MTTLTTSCFISEEEEIGHGELSESEPEKESESEPEVLSFYQY